MQTETWLLDMFSSTHKQDLFSCFLASLQIVKIPKTPHQCWYFPGLGLNFYKKGRKQHLKYSSTAFPNFPIAANVKCVIKWMQTVSVSQENPLPSARNTVHAQRCSWSAVSAFGFGWLTCFKVCWSERGHFRSVGTQSYLRPRGGRGVLVPFGEFWPALPPWEEPKR